MNLALFAKRALFCTVKPGFSIQISQGNCYIAGSPACCERTGFPSRL